MYDSSYFSPISSSVIVMRQGIVELLKKSCAVQTHCSIDGNRANKNYTCSVLYFNHVPAPVDVVINGL